MQFSQFKQNAGCLPGGSFRLYHPCEKTSSSTTDSLLVQAQSSVLPHAVPSPLSFPLFYRLRYPERASPNPSILSTKLQVPKLYPPAPFAALSGTSTRILFYQATTLFWHEPSCLQKSLHPPWSLWEMPSLITDAEVHEMRKLVHAQVFHLFISTHTHALSPPFLCYFKKFKRKSDNSYWTCGNSAEI